MCGIAGFFGKSDNPAALVRTMAAALEHRGPDDSGHWIDDESGVALAHRRLSIVDGSSAGHQPMTSASGRFVISFNGEIYNHAELRKQIGQRQWNGHSDTETLLAAFETWGIQRTLDRLVGMFAFAVWDVREQVLTLARDRIGEKPLYYGIYSGTIIFASELKGLMAHPRFDGEIDPDALALYLRYAYVPAPYSIYRSIKKLPAGTLMEIGRHTGIGTPIQYWSLADTVIQGRDKPFAGSDDEACAELEHVLKQAIRGQMVADVPLGAFLSGGIDSSTVVALMQTQATRPVRTFSIGFDDALFDEARYASSIARHLGCDHTELYVGPKTARDVIPMLPQIYDEPFADSSQIPTYLVSRLAREHVTVSISGDGADELFGGYSRYLFTANMWNRIGWMPQPIRSGMAGMLSCISPRAWNRGFSLFDAALPGRWKFANPGAKLHKLANVLPVDSPKALYGKLISSWDDPVTVVKGANRGLSSPALPEDPQLGSFVEYMMYADLTNYLPDDILVKVDRAAMAVSLETRIPFLDHRVVEFASRLPLRMKLRNGRGKWLLRQVLYRYVPESLVERPKMGFGVPLDTWLRGPLREWAEDLLSTSSLRQEGFFEPAPIRTKWKEHLSETRNWQFALWNVLMFQAWLRHQRYSTYSAQRPS